jgi:hypothetical protein
MLLFESEILEVTYSPEGNYLTTTWFGETPVDEFNEGIDYIMAFFYEKKASGLLIDTTQHLGVDKEGQQYASDQLKRYINQEQVPVSQAVVVAENVFANYSVQNFSDDLLKEDQGFVIRYFTSMDQAHQWLVEQYRKALA